jgi:hypothetical protein
MARIIGGLTSSHIPAVGNAIANNQTQEPYWKRFFDGYKPAQAWLSEKKPDVAIVVYNDHGLNFFLDKVPTFALGCADVYRNDDEGWALKPVAPFKGDAQFSWHIAESLIRQEFDICTCQEMKVDHGFVNPIRALYGTHEVWPVTTIPLAVNTVQHPVPTALHGKDRERSAMDDPVVQYGNHASRGYRGHRDHHVAGDARCAAVQCEGRAQTLPRADFQHWRGCIGTGELWLSDQN